MVRRNSIEASTRSSMADFDNLEFIHSSEFQEKEDQADLKFFCGAFSRLVATTEEQSEKCVSMKAMLVEIQNTLSTISNQLGLRPIEADSSQQAPPVMNSSDPFCADLNRLPLDNRKRLMPEFDGSHVSDWLSNVERFFSVRRYSDLDKLDLVAFSLEGAVLNWFNWEMIRSEFHSWDEFRRRLLLKFGAAPEKSSENVAEILEERASYTEKKGIVSASVTESAELLSQGIGLDESHLEQLFSTGLQTEMKEVLKLKEPMGLENQKPAVLRMDTFTSKPVASVNFLSFAVGTADNLFSGLSPTSQVWEPGGVFASVNVAASLGETASYTEEQLILQSQEMDSTNGTGVDVESANGANRANGGGDIDALPPPPPILPPNVEPLHVKTAPVEKKNLRVPMARTGIGTKGQKIPLLTNHFKVDVADLQGHFSHYSVALFYDDGCHVEAQGIGRKILDKVHAPYHSDLVGKEFAYDGEKTLFTYGVLPDNKLDFAVVLEEVSAARPNGNVSPNGYVNDGDRKRLRRPHRTEPVTECKTSDAIFQLVLEQTVAHDMGCVGFFLFIHLEDKVCLSGASNSWCGWRVFDRGKNKIISGDVITLVLWDLKKCFFHGAEKRDVQTMLLVKAKNAHVDSLIVRIKVILSCGVALGKRIQWAEIQKLSWYKELWIKIMDGDIAKLLNSAGGKLQSYGFVLRVTFLHRLRVHQQQKKRRSTKSWRFKYKSRLQEINPTDTRFLCEKVHRASCLLQA